MDRIRISTRPDSLTHRNLLLLLKYKVKTVELGVQSMDETVLVQSGRGHNADDVISAVRLLREFNFKIGIQLMPGLPGDTFHKTMESAFRVSMLKPDFVRIYPTVVIKGTPLFEAYKNKTFHPISLADTVKWCAGLLVHFKKNKINVIRIGLQPVPSLENEEGIAVGPYHPALRQLVESYISYLVMESAVNKWGINGEKIIFTVPECELSYYIGQKRSNIKKLIKKFDIDTLIKPCGSLKRGTFSYDGGNGLGAIATAEDLIYKKL